MCSQIPCDPKLLIDQVRPAELAAFKLTSLERNPRRGLPLTPDLGIHISVLDVGRYAVPDIVLPMDPEDEALIAVQPRPSIGPRTMRSADLLVALARGYSSKRGFSRSEHSSA